MKVLYDHQIFSVQKYGGISRYFAELIKGIPCHLPIIMSDNGYLNDTEAEYLKVPINFRGKRTLTFFINQQKMNFWFKKNNFDLFHPTYYDPYFLKFLGEKPFVLTIHDMIHEKFPSFFSHKDNTPGRKKLLASIATRIIAVSEQTKNDIVEILNCHPDKIDVIHHGCCFENIVADNDFEEKLTSRYILFTGKRTGYKNFTNFVRALATLLTEQRDLRIMCVGGNSFTLNEKMHFIELNIENQIEHIDKCSDSELKALYQNAVFFVFPSLYEGFGLPLLEAMASRTPIICSNTGCFKEIAGDSAIFFNPHDIEDMEVKMKNAFYSDLSDIVQKGIDRYKKFTWERAVAETKETYLKAIKQN